MSKENVLTDQPVAIGLEPVVALGSSSTRDAVPVGSGSALDPRTTALLDPAKILLHGENMRRRGSDIARTRPTVVAAAADVGDVDEAVELSTLDHLRRRSTDIIERLSFSGPSPVDLESAPGSTSVSVRPPFSREDTTASSTAPLLSPAERKRQRRQGLIC